MAVQTKNFTVRFLRHHRVATILGLLFSLVSESGCARARPAIKSLWQQVPPVRWPSKDAHTSAEPPERAAEPVVAANVALKYDATLETDSPSIVASGDSRPKSSLARFGPHFIRPEPQAGDATTISDSADSTEANSKKSADTNRMDSPLERLNAALTDDVRQSLSLPQRSVTTLEERARVDSLLSRARELFEIGQLDQARETALLAQELGETAQLDYSPDEDRPVDLIRRIEGQIESTSRTENPDRDEGTPESPMASKERESSSLTVGRADLPNPANDEAKGQPRVHRSWSTLFRRDKKLTAATSSVEPVAHTSKEVTLGMATDPAEPSQTFVRSSHTIPHDAVVMANRSISLETPESIEESVESFVPETAPIADPDSFRSEIPSLADVEIRDAQQAREMALATNSGRLNPNLDSDEGVFVPEFDAVEVVPLQREAKSTVEELPSDAMDSAETNRRSDWTYYYLAIGICSLLAFGCYRRGAT